MIGCIFSFTGRRAYNRRGEGGSQAAVYGVPDELPAFCLVSLRLTMRTPSVRSEQFYERSPRSNQKPR